MGRDNRWKKGLIGNSEARPFTFLLHVVLEDRLNSDVQHWWVIQTRYFQAVFAESSSCSSSASDGHMCTSWAFWSSVLGGWGELLEAVHTVKTWTPRWGLKGEVQEAYGVWEDMCDSQFGTFWVACSPGMPELRQATRLGPPTSGRFSSDTNSLNSCLLFCPTRL